MTPQNAMLLLAKMITIKPQCRLLEFWKKNYRRSFGIEYFLDLTKDIVSHFKFSRVGTFLFPQSRSPTLLPTYWQPSRHILLIRKPKDGTGQVYLPKEQKNLTMQSSSLYLNFIRTFPSPDHDPIPKSIPIFMHQSPHQLLLPS